MTRRNKHFRDLPSQPFEADRLPAEFKQFFNRKVLPRLELHGYKLPEQRATAMHIVHNLVGTALVGACVADSRDTGVTGVRLRLKVWSAIVAAGLADMCLGSEASGMVTRYRATSKLLQLRRQWELRLLVDLQLERNSELEEATRFALVYLHTGKIDLATGQPLPEVRQKQPMSFVEYIKQNAQRDKDGNPDPRAVRNGMAHLRAVEDMIESINRSNLQHTWQAFHTDPETGRKTVFQPNPCLRQIHSGRYFRAVRLYSFGKVNGQGLPKQVRRTMLIDGEAVAELDFSGMATRMLYHFCGHDPKGDVYRPAKVFQRYYEMQNASEAKRGVVRDFVKKATNICWNVATRQKAVGAIRKLLRDHEEGKFLRKLVCDVENLSPSELLDRIVAAHPLLEDRFFTEVGLELMTADGNIMLRILNRFALAGKPVLGIHDSVVCRASDVEFAHETMRQGYRESMTFDPVIRRVY